MPEPTESPNPVKEAIAFYRDHPLVLAVALVAATVLGAAVLLDGDVGVGEAIGVVAAGSVIGLIYAAVRSGNSADS